jgi:hypothetical protein
MTGVFGALINDLKKIEGVINESTFVINASYLATSIMIFLETANEENFSRYNQFVYGLRGDEDGRVKTMGFVA